LILCVVYRSPNSTDDTNKVLLQSVVEMYDKKLDNLIFIGDFNLPGIYWNNWCSSNNNPFEIDFINILGDFYILQHVSCPTRFRGSNTPHILDLIISNDSFIEEVKHLGNNEHYVINVTKFIKICRIQQFAGYFRKLTRLLYYCGQYVYSSLYSKFNNAIMKLFLWNSCWRVKLCDLYEWINSVNWGLISNRIVAVWNSLPNIVVSAEPTNIFKNRLDKFWMN